MAGAGVVGGWGLRGRDLSQKIGATMHRTRGNAMKMEHTGYTNTLMGRLQNMGDSAWSNLKHSAGGGGLNVLQQAGMSALKAGVVGGVVGGAAEAAQGGSFWEGAKSGAWNAGMGYGAYRTFGRAVGATTRNPFGRGGPVKSMDRMWRQSSDGVSKPVKALLSHRQRTQMAKSVYAPNPSF